MDIQPYSVGGTFLTRRRSFNVREYRAMLQAGILQEDDPLELIEGEIITMSPVNARHALCVRRLIRLFTRSLGDRAILDIQNPIQLDDRTEPQPDVVLLKPREDFYRAYPTPDDVLLLIEVADSSVGYDRTVKAPLYARNRIGEFWLVNLAEVVVEVYREPTAHGYCEQRRYWPGDGVTPLAFPEARYAVAEMLDQSPGPAQ